MTDILSIASLIPASRPPAYPVAIAGPDREALSWEHFAAGLDSLREGILAYRETRWALHTEDHALFLLGLIALLQCGREVHLPPLSPPALPGAGEEPLPVLSDAGNPKLRLALPEAIDASPLNWPRINPEKARLVFHTSGSTGAPKLVPKNLVQVENELVALAALWGGDFRGAVVFSTVSPLHFYGFLFTALLPFVLGVPIAPVRLQYPESLAALAGRKTVLVTSPAFLKRLGDAGAHQAVSPAPVKVFSSGGFLPEAAARLSAAVLGAPVHEIYGSTETGGIAWKRSGADGPKRDGWTLFPGVTAERIEAEGFTVASSYLPPPGRMRIEDRIEEASGNAILLLGRTDSVVKIEEKRVALNDVENRLFQTGLVEDAVVLAFDEGRQFLAAAVAFNRAGRERFSGRPKLELNRFFKNHLRAFFEPLVIPRKWRFPESIPRNTQGKIDRAAARALFTEAPALIAEPVVRERIEDTDRLVLLLVFPADYIHFQGHFPEMKLLPAVSQVDWAMKFAHRHFGLELLMREIPRFKCMKPIFPDAPVRLELALDRAKNQLAFTYADPADGAIHSQGKIALGAPS